MLKQVVSLIIGVLIYLYHKDGGVVNSETLKLIEKVTLEENQVNELQALNLTTQSPIKFNNRIIHGRFLHISDIHPDPYYKVNSSQGEACHAGDGNSGEYGDAVLGCDSPVALMEGTLRWINDNLKDKIDFIIWTGDNIRHDNDRRYPRTEMHIFDMNQHVSDLFYDIVKNPDTKNPRNLLVDIIPSLGNNDVYPHNLFSPGPTLQTREMFKIWSNFVPQNQFHIFNRGAYFFKEVIPDQLAVLSINTLYLYQSNPLVDNCDKKKEPGYKLFQWLGVVLKEMRQRNMKVWLSGHVPPNEKNYDVSCLRKYIIWSYEYRDVIIGGLYGHMNIDHFIPLDAKKAYKSLKELEKKKQKKKKGKNKSGNIEIPDFDLPPEIEEYYQSLIIEDDDIYEQDTPMKITGGVPNNKVRYMEGLRDDLYSDVKPVEKSGIDGERYSIAHVSASIVPTFNPGLRVWEYNISDLDTKLANSPRYASWDDFFQGVDEFMMYLDQVDDVEEDDTYGSFDYFTFKKDKSLPPKKPADIPLGPAYTPQTFSPIRYTQYYADLAAINKGEKRFNFEYEYSTDDSIYAMNSLLVSDWLSFSRVLGDSKKQEKSSKEGKTWLEFLSHCFVDSDYENMGYG